MSIKYWALIVSFRPHIFSLGKHETIEEAETMARSFCDRKTEENQQIFNEHRNTNPDAIEPSPYQLAFVMDESDLRVLIGEIHRPLVISKIRKEVAVEPPERRGGQNTETTEAAED